jgi:hypothetical protein
MSIIIIVEAPDCIAVVFFALLPFEFQFSHKKRKANLNKKFRISMKGEPQISFVVSDSSDIL